MSAFANDFCEIILVLAGYYVPENLSGDQTGIKRNNPSAECKSRWLNGYYISWDNNIWDHVPHGFSHIIHCVNILAQSVACWGKETKNNMVSFKDFGYTKLGQLYVPYVPQIFMVENGTMKKVPMFQGP